MKRAGFTMIELIFVIVILGILAAVAIPKLAATRTDAQVAKGASDTATLLGELGSYYTAQGTFALKDTNDITNVQVKAHDTSLADADVLIITDDNDADCLTFTFNNVLDGNVTLTGEANASTLSAVCKGMIGATADMQKEHNFGGSNVVW